MGLALLFLSLYALRGLMESLTSPQSMSVRHTEEFALVMVLIALFAAACTMGALLFLVVGLRWLRAAAAAD